MKASLFTSIAAALVSFASAYTQPVGSPDGNPITKPGLNEIVPVGKPYTITWTPTAGDTVTLVLLRGPGENIKPLYPIVEKTPNSGTYVWTPSTDLENDETHYGIQLIVDSTGQFQYSTQFGISNPGYNSAAPTTTTSSTPSSYSASSSSSSTTEKAVPETYATPTTTPTVPPTTNRGGYITSGSVVYSTSMVTVTSCGPAVTNCPYKNTTSTKVPTSYPVPTTYKSPNATVTPIISPGAGEKVRVGGAMAVVFLAGLSLFL